MESDQSASRAARRFLQDRVRNDWDWPNIPPCFSASDEEVRDVTVFRERFYGTSSDVSSEEEGEGEKGQAAYKFDDPESVGITLEAREERRKRRRRERERREIEGGNEGLRMYVERRDAWTGVLSVRKYGVGKPGSKTTTAVDAHLAEKNKNKENEETPQATVIPDDASKATPPTSIQSSSNTTTPLETSLIVDSPPLVPLAPPLLPNNTIRHSITPKSYPDIYSKIVLQSRTPAVPINLSDMTKALVLGWKDHGEWPPKSGPLDPLAGGKKKAVLAGIGLGNQGGGGGPASPKPENGEAFLSNHPHLQRGVEHLQKMLHFRTGGSPQEEGATRQQKDGAPGNFV